MKSFKVIFRELFRYYLRNFPIRDGKVSLYHSFNQILTPSQRFIEVKIKLGFKLLLDLNEPTQRMIYFFGNYDERHELSMLQKLLSPGEVFWDVGANIGFYTLAASTLVGQEGLVVAFEPGPHSWRALMANIDLNQRPNIIPFKMAVAADYGWVTLFSQPDIADGGASLILRPDPSCRPDLCPAINLDSFLQDFGLAPPTFLKVDVEGAEALVLAGSRRLLANPAPPLLLLEMNDPQTVSEFLQDLGYVGAQLYRRKWYLCENPVMAKSRNMLWFHPDHEGHRQRVAKIPVYSGRQD